MKTYCPHCKTFRALENPQPIVLESGKPALEGPCQSCGAVLVKVVFPSACQ